MIDRQLQERIDRFNEDEAVWRSFDEARTLRHRLGSRLRLPIKILEYIDWREAERKHQRLNCFGRQV